MRLQEALGEGNEKLPTGLKCRGRWAHETNEEGFPV
jgi:hypothetical protein